MSYFIGIDLGTTNSAICSYDGDVVRIYKSPEQNDVAPSAIYVDRRSRYYGKRAYDMAARSDENVAMNFKRFMGTSTPIKIPAMSITMTPEECSAEILKILFSYLPEEIRNSSETGTVITVPAAFNQMQRDATLSAAEMSGIGKVALMQEPVAAVMSVMKVRNSDGIFLIYDLGGGTFDIALAQSISKRVSLLEHGGIVMCGGRDFDRIIVDNIVNPWLLKNFDLPENFSSDSKYGKLKRLSAWASERAKIELSMKNDSLISLNEDEIRLQDAGGKDIYLDIPLDHKMFDSFIKSKVLETVAATREVLERAQLTPHDIERIVFIGGPTQYKPLRDMVSFELGISADTQLNPMTAVAEGAAIFSESIDWSSKNKERKSSRGTISTGGNFNLDFVFSSRTSEMKARIAVKANGQILPGSKFQIDNMDTGWDSGRIDLKDGASLSVGLTKNGENRFKVWVFDPSGGPISIENNTVIITRTAATIDAIPASHYIGIEVKEKISGSGTKLKYLVKKDDSLPKKGSIDFQAAEALRAKGPGSINVKLWEGEVKDSIECSDFVGCLTITGADFDAGIINPGDKVICEYEVSDSGRVSLSISVPSVAGTWARDDFYSRAGGGIDFFNAGHLVMKESETLIEKVDDFSDKVNDPRLDLVKEKLQESQELAQREGDPESSKLAMQNIQEAKRLMAKVRKEHLPSIRQLELDGVVSFFQDHVREFAKASEITSFESMIKSAKRVIDSKASEFENIIDQMKNMNWQILWRQDWFVVDTFKRLGNEEYLFMDKVTFTQLINAGTDAVKQDKIDELRNVVVALYGIRMMAHSEQDMFLQSNIL